MAEYSFMRSPSIHALIQSRPLFFGNCPVKNESVCLGAGSSSWPLATKVADKNFIGNWFVSTAATGTVRGIYQRLIIAGASPSGGESARFVTQVEGVAVGGGVHGVHSTLHINSTASSAVTGLGCGLRATLEITAASRTVGGTLCALEVDSFIGTGNTVSHVSFIRVCDVGAVAVPYLFEIPASTVTRKGSAVSSVGGLAILLDGALAYLMYGT